VIASVTSSTHEIKSKTVITMDKEKIYLQLNQFTKPVCIANPVSLLNTHSISLHLDPTIYFNLETGNTSKANGFLHPYIIPFLYFV
jgi:hypothetical protein